MRPRQVSFSGTEKPQAEEDPSAFFVSEDNFHRGEVAPLDKEEAWQIR